MIITLALLVAGYVLGRWRPVHRLVRWSEWKLPEDGSWWAAKSRTARIVYALSNRWAIRRYLAHRRGARS